MKQILSKLLIVLSICVVHCTYLSAQNTITILNEKEGKFQKAVEGKWKKEKKTIVPMSEVTRLSIRGIFDAVDFNYLSTTFTNLEFLDIEHLQASLTINKFSKVNSLNDLNNLKELWLPLAWETFKIPEGGMRSLHKLQMYNTTHLLNHPFIAKVLIKTEKYVGKADFSSPFPDDSPVFATGSGAKVGLLILTPEVDQYVEKLRWGSRHFNLIYERGNKNIFLNMWEDHYTQQVLNHVTHLAGDGNLTGSTNKSKGLLSNLQFAEVIINAKITELPAYCFNGNRVVEKITLSNNITKIPRGCFTNCPNLNNIDIPKNVWKIEEYAIGVKNITIHGAPSLKTTSFWLELIETITLKSATPPKVEDIKVRGWEKWAPNIKVYVPEGSYAEYAKSDFWKSTKMEEPGEKLRINITSENPGDFLPQLPNISLLHKIDSLTVTGIVYNTDLNVVKQCRNLKYIDFSNAIIMESPQSAEASKQQAAELYAMFAIIEAAMESKYKAGEISELDYLGASSKVTNVLSATSKVITEASDLCYIPRSAFSNMPRLEHIKLPLSSKNVGDYALNGCKSLKVVEMPLFATGIGERAFYDCISLKEIKIPSSVSSLGDMVFRGCESLEKIDFRGCTFKNKLKNQEGVCYLNAFTSYTGAVYLPEGITSITTRDKSYSGTAKFHFPESLSMINCSFHKLELYFYSKTPPALRLGANGRKASISNSTIYVPKGYTMTYYSAYGDSNKYVEME